MRTENVHDALQQIREIKVALIAGEKFTGYSGRTRAVAGTLTLLGTLVMSRPFFPEEAEAHLAGWSLVGLAALIANYSALLHWFFFHPNASRDWRRLVPAAEGLPPIFVGGVLSVVLVFHGMTDLLFGTWMCLFGLTNLSSRRVLPRGSWSLGLFYISCGTGCLLLPISFTNPWPMGIVFFIGELLGGYMFHIHRLPEWRMKSEQTKWGRASGRMD